MTNATTAQATTAPTLPAHIQALVNQLHDLIAVHGLLALHSQRQIATQLGLSRRRVNDLSKMRPPTTLDMSATTSEFDLTEFNTEPTMLRQPTRPTFFMTFSPNESLFNVRTRRPVYASAANTASPISFVPTLLVPRS